MLHTMRTGVCASAGIDTFQAGSCVLGTEMASANVDVIASAGFCVLYVLPGAVFEAYC